MAAAGTIAPRSVIVGFALLFAAALADFSLSGAARAQPQLEPSAPPPAAQPPASDARMPARPEGFFDALGRWWDRSAADFKAGIEENNAKWRELSERNQKAAKDAAAATREAAEALGNLSKIRIIEGRQVCDIAPNGSPDCVAAAETICKANGFASGKSADIQSSRKCSARALLEGERSARACTTETIVVKAACQ